MDVLEIVLLALIQGLTEFLPISSSAHLILPSQVLGWQDQGLAFDVAVHVGTLLAVASYFRRDLAALTAGWIRSLRHRELDSQYAVMGWAVVVGTVPAGLVGLLFNHWIELNLRSAWVIAATTLLFGVLLWWADRTASLSRGENAFRIRDGLVIGLAQTLALIPGTSRSGITMTAALMLGLDRQTSARFSFLLSVPLIAIAGGLKTLELIDVGDAADWQAIFSGALIAFVSAYSCIHFFLKFLDRIGFLPFVIYRMILGTGLLIWLMFFAT